MKKILCIFLPFILLMVVFPAAASGSAGEVLFTLTDASELHGDTVTVTVWMTPLNEAHIEGFDLSVDCDPLLFSIENVTAGPSFSQLEIPVNTDTGRIHMAWFTTVSAITDNRILMTIDLRIRDSAPAGIFNLPLTCSTLYDNSIDMAEHSYTVEGGIIKIVPSEITSDIYTVSDGLLTGISPGTTAGELLSNLDCIEFIKIMDHDKTVLVNAAIKTGMTVNLMNGSTVICSLIIAVTGDTNCSGTADIADIVDIRDHILGKSLLSGAALAAANADYSGDVSVSDIVAVRDYILGKSSL